MYVPIFTKAAVLLGLRKGPAFGLELVERIYDLTNLDPKAQPPEFQKTNGVKNQRHRAIYIKNGSFYPGMKKLEEEGLVKAEVVHYGEGKGKEPTPEWQEGGGHTRVFYTLTTKGQQEADDISSMLRKLVK